MDEWCRQMTTTVHRCGPVMFSGHIIAHVLSCCSENYCMKCALIFLALVWLTEGHAACGCNDDNGEPKLHNVSMATVDHVGVHYYGTNKRIVWRHWVWCSLVMMGWFSFSFLFFPSDCFEYLNKSCQNNTHGPSLSGRYLNVSRCLTTRV